MKPRHLAVLLFVAVACSSEAQDARWLGMWERAQEERPDRLSSEARIASADEPGVPMVIHGRVFGEDGETPRPDVVVFAYQTDRGGLYHEPGARDWRLRGWAKTDRDGRFVFRTIRPGSYPSGTASAHVHFVLEGGGVPRQFAGLHFADDPLLSSAARRRSEREGRFGEVRPVETRDGVQHVDLRIRASSRADF